MSAVSGKGTRLNRRGLETRRTVLDAAVRCLAEGGVDAVSANRVAREAGVTWGTVQHQFGDADGLWAAVLAEVEDTGRVADALEQLWAALDSESARAVFNLRAALPPDRAALEAEFPKSAAAIAQVRTTSGR